MGAKGTIGFIGIGLGVCLASSLAAAAAPTRVLADTLFLKSLGIKALHTDETLQLSVAEVSEYQAETMAHSAHKFGKCGGFERLNGETNPVSTLESLRAQAFQARAFSYVGNPHPNLEKQAPIEGAVQMVNEQNIRATVQWLSQYPTRFHKGKTNNLHVEELAQKVKGLLAEVNYPTQVDFISHTNTPQKSLRVRLQGSSHPQEVVVLGGHLDSIANWGAGRAPGADDNASGSANVLETLRVLTTQKQPSRTVEFFWYAGEEAGLIGSSEIAQTYKKNGIQVVGVMQLDMTLYPGEGELVLGDMTDYTNPWLRGYMHSINDLYVGARWKEDECGYGCSDHASWHRQGYPAVMPFEAVMNTMNDDIHTDKDIISPALSFKHSVAFTQLAVAFVMDLSNSELKPSL